MGLPSYNYYNVVNIYNYRVDCMHGELILVNDIEGRHTAYFSILVVLLFLISVSYAYFR